MTTEEAATDESHLSNHWPSVLLQIHLHLFASFGFFLLYREATWSTTFFLVGLVFFGILGLTLGCHRLWAHNTYRAAWPVRALFAAGQTLVCNGSVLDWVWWHRLHHEHHGTDLDPYNYKKGFFFCHVSSRCTVTNPSQERARKHLPIGDLEEDNVIFYQNFFYWVIMPVVGVLLPIYVGVELLGESLLLSVFVLGFLRTVVLLHASWLIHSAYIIWGLDPLDKRSTDTWLVFFFNKSLWPQYHYLLPWDYRSGEFGTYDSGCSTAILRVLAAMGLVNGLTTISCNGVKSALAAAAETGTPLVKCLEEAKIELPDIINQDPNNF